MPCVAHNSLAFFLPLRNCCPRLDTEFLAARTPALPRGLRPACSGDQGPWLAPTLQPAPDGIPIVLHIFVEAHFRVLDPVFTLYCGEAPGEPVPRAECRECDLIRSRYDALDTDFKVSGVGEMSKACRYSPAEFSGAAEVEQLKCVCCGIDEEVSRACVPMDDAELQVEVVHNLHELLKVLQF